MTQVVTAAPARRPPPSRRWRWLVIGVLLGAAVGVLAIVTLWLRGRGPTAPNGALDTPLEAAQVTQPTLVYGWAIDQGAGERDGTGVDRVEVYLDGTPLADARYGEPRPDIAAAFGAHFGASGWSATLDPSGLTRGPHILEAQAHSTLSNASTSYTHTILVKPASAPQGAVDVPVEGATLGQTTEIRGWAIDQLAADGTTGVDRVQLFLDGQPLGEATYGAARPDVAASFGDPFGGSGWSASLDPTGRPPGQHTLDVRAHSVVSGDDTTYSRGVVLEAPTAPRGSLDDPADGAVIQGVVDIRGWAIDEAAPSGTGIDRISLYLDGQHVADAELSQTQSRPDIGDAYGARFASSGWTATLDVSTVPPGPHTLEVRARSTASGLETHYTHTVVVEPSS